MHLAGIQKPGTSGNQFLCIGIPYWTSDIGGYHLKWQLPIGPHPINREMFTRWFQFGTFSPVFRIHGKGERALFSENWDVNTKAILLKYNNLRYRLMPYIYSLSWKVTNEAYTILRALAFDFRTDAAITGITDQYMFGPAFLVNPVTDQMYSLNSMHPRRKQEKFIFQEGSLVRFLDGEDSRRRPDDRCAFTD